jgi:hypothetical protein
MLLCTSFAGASAQTLAPGAVKLLPSNEYVDTYKNPDGTYTAVISEKPIRMRTAAGWKELTGALEPTDSPAFLAKVNSRVTTRLGGASAAAWNTVTRDGRSVSFALAEASASPGVAQVNGQSVRFNEALPGTDLALTTTPEGGVKEEFLIKSPASAPWNGEFAYQMNLNGLDARQVTDETGSHLLLPDSGTGNASPVMHFAPPFAVDSKGNRTDNCWYILSDDR